MGSFKMGLLAQFETILPKELRLPPENYLKGIDKRTLLKLSSFLLANDISTSKFNDWRDFLKMWFRPENDLFAIQVWQRCETLEFEEKEPVTFLFPVAALKLFEFAFSLEEVQTVQDPAISEVNLFKAYLIFLSESTKNETSSVQYLEQMDIKLRPALTLLNNQFPSSDFTNFELGDVFITQTIKSYYLFKFLNASADTKNLVNAFYKYFKIISWKEYFQLLVPIMVAYLKKPDGWIDLNVVEGDNFIRRCHFLDALSIKNLDSELNADFKMLRGNPMYKVDEGKYSVIYTLFVIEKIYKGLYFKLKELNEELPEDEKIRDFRSFYTTNFTESCLLYNVIDYIYGRRSYIKFSGDALKKKGLDGSPDYYIRSGNNLFLFENKDVFINAEVKHSGDFQKIETEFARKFYYEEKKGKIRPKAILQIINNVKKVLLKENEFDKNYNVKNIKIYPILILHDSSFNCVALNFLVNYWFQLELIKLKNNGLNTSQVRKLTIINIDTLVLYADYLKIKKMALNDLIDQYIRFCFFNEQKRYKDFLSLKEAYGEKLLSFSFFIGKFTNIGFKNVTHSLRDHTMKEIFELS